MNDTFTLFQEAYASADQKTKDLIDSDHIGLFADTLIIERSNYVQKHKIIIALSNRILNVSTDSFMVDRLEEAGLDTEAIAKAKIFVEERNSTNKPSLIHEIDEVQKQISTVRTMSSDSNAPASQPEATYSSVQSAILNESK